MTKTPPLAPLLGVSLIALLLLVGAACPRKDDTRAKAAAQTTQAAASPEAVSVTQAPAAPVADAPPAASAPPRPPFEKQPEGARVALLYTASVEGYVAPCGCTADPLGGVARLAATVSAAREAYGERVVFVDGGDLLFEKPDDNLAADACQAEARVELLLGTYAKQGLAATVLGPLDDVRGAAWRDQRMKAHGILTVGVGDAGRKLSSGAAHKPGVVVDAGGVKVGVTGFRVDAPKAVQAAHDALAKEVARLYAEGAVSVVALAQAPRALVPGIARDIPGLDVVVQGRDPGELPRAPEKLGEGTYWVAAAAQAQHVGIVELVLEGRQGKAPLALDDRVGAAARRAKLLDERIEQYQRQVDDMEPGQRRDFVAGRLAGAEAERASLASGALPGAAPAGPRLKPTALPLARGYPEEPAAKAALDRYEDSIPALVSTCEANIECPAAPPGSATYVGVEACFQCHRSQVQFWQQQVVEAPGKDEQGNAIVRKLSHATAWDTLVHEGKAADRSCVGCHSIGFNEPGGYCKTSEVDFRQNVQCEACHGPASLHVESAGDPSLLVRRDVDESVCRRCHQVPHIPTSESFVFDDKLRHILGDGHGKARLDEIIRGAGSRGATGKE